MIRPLLASFVVAATMVSASAEPAAPSCVAWLKERTTTLPPDLRAWALGVIEEYASGLPEHSSANLADTENILTHVDIYCQAHPADHLDHALQSAIAILKNCAKR
jgi:hypothetical protein